ncbi:hypothetical protein Chor_001600, partial [Crotalus horridus]
PGSVCFPLTDGIASVCQPIGLENGANPPAEWFPRSQGPGLRPPNSEVDNSERNFRVNLHCKYGRPRCGALLELSQREGDPAMERSFAAKADEKRREGDGQA